MAFLKVTKELFYSRNDPEDLRLGDLVEDFASLKDLKDFFVIAGYPDDEGVKANHGRVGARKAPETIRKAFYKQTPHLLSERTPKFTDIGDLEIRGSLDERQKGAVEEIEKTLKQGANWIGLGGGHDWGYVDGLAYLQSQSQKKEKPLIINFDAHLDVRSDHQGTNSGTSFFKLLSKNSNIDFFEIGLQSQCNSRAHLNWLQEKGGKALFYDELLLSSQPVAEKILNFLDEAILKKREAYVSVDIDAFANAWAPGCSQGFATGLNPEDFFRVLEVLKERLKIRVFGIYEVSPLLDVDDRTSKLAALILHRLIF